MKSLILAAALAIVPLGLGAGAASAFERHTTVDTWRGTYQKHVEADCHAGYCTRESEFVGPNGGTVSREGACWRVGWRAVHCRGSVTGPEGHTVFGRGTFFVR